MRFALVMVSCLWIAGCGYVGEPMPPALNIPMRIVDLKAEQVGGRMKLRFTIPDLTTEKLPVKQVTVELRGGDAPIPVAARVPGLVEAEGPLVAAWLGRETAFMVRLQNAKGRFSEWSNVVLRQVVATVATPARFTAQAAEGGVALAWSGPGDGWAIFRDGLPLAEVDKAGYLDAAAEVGKSYRYQMEAWTKAGSQRAASERTTEVAVTNIDTFPPMAPKALSVIASTNTIELSWERSLEADFKQYRVWRDGQVLAAAVDVPAYTDRTAEGGKKYSYAVSAVDLRGNESSKSQPVEITTP